jgi:hypothetical protein
MLAAPETAVTKITPPAMVRYGMRADVAALAVSDTGPKVEFSLWMRADMITSRS